MVPYNLQRITWMQIEIFFRCAELKNFTKAAAELHITTGMVSKKIAALESALGFPLFLREKNRVELTTAGEKLYAAWQQSMDAMVGFATDLKRRNNEDQTLTFSLWGSTNLERFFVPLINAFSAEGDILFRISMQEDFCILDDVASGKSDVAFVPKFAERGIREIDELEYFLALPSPLYAALSADNPLSRKKVLQVEDLQGVNLLMAEDALTWYVDMIQDLCLDHGFTARIKFVDKHVFSTNYLCMDDDTVLITDKYFHAFTSNAVEYRELQNTESGLLVVYQKNASPHIRRLVEFAWAFYKELR